MCRHVHCLCVGSPFLKQICSHTAVNLNDNATLQYRNYSLCESLFASVCMCELWKCVYMNVCVCTSLDCLRARLCVNHFHCTYIYCWELLRSKSAGHCHDELPIVNEMPLWFIYQAPLWIYTHFKCSDLLCYHSLIRAAVNIWNKGAGCYMDDLCSYTGYSFILMNAERKTV